MTTADADPVALLRTAIARSGLSARAFAVTVLARDERTIRRWLANDRPMPVPVVRFLTQYLESPPCAR